MEKNSKNHSQKIQSNILEKCERKRMPIKKTVGNLLYRQNMIRTHISESGYSQNRGDKRKGFRLSVYFPLFFYRIYRPAKNQATNPITPTTIATMLRAIKPQTASPPSPMATRTNIAARISPWPVSSILRSLLWFFCLLSSSNLLRDESSHTLLTNRIQKSDMIVERTSALNRGFAAAPHPQFSLSPIISCKVMEKQVLGVRIAFLSQKEHLLFPSEFHDNLIDNSLNECAGFKAVYYGWGVLQGMIF
jgi:hypothetical protein